MLRTALGLVICLNVAFLAAAQEYRVEVIKEAPPKEELAKEMQGQFADQGLRVMRGAKSTVCEVWPSKVWKTAADFKPSSERLYPFSPGQLIGLIHFKRRGKDFREQTINRGWYTLRFGLQPTDGNHEGTSPTRDFLLMVSADEDKAPDALGVKRLMTASAEAAESSHPAMLCLQPAKETKKKTPYLHHDEDRDWWVLRFSGKSGTKDKTKELPVDLIVVGHADE